jgi:LysR family hydrogen peroxide-inducible transcriptional activator
VQIVDRSKVPVVPTAEGVEIIQQARVILREVQRLSEVTRERQGEIVGDLRSGVLPTIAPSLLPLFLDSFLQRRLACLVSLSRLYWWQRIRRREAKS